ncbi:hypothetical protein LCN96_01035 [Nonomuraea gerenzanensis]|uniref:hypothetical protein n=1 Tax=Nonomuraea gerenzanensis TaxID=93944 RepID=UPI001CD93FFE|nr:hypothetical protein [Nonomuraea gerenzanensis]UBU19168.1 hypothetical protein LCN96_01035 [Nonomuraea gerenzanensis]
MQGGLAAAQHEDVELAVLALQALVDVGQDVGDRDDAGQVGGAVGEAGGAAQVAGLGDVLEEDAGVLGLQLGQAAEVGGGDGVEVAGGVGGVVLGGSGPLLQIFQDFWVFVVQGADKSVFAASAFQPHAAVALRQITAQPLDPVEVAAMAARAERVDVPEDAVTPQTHPCAHVMTFHCEEGLLP